MTEDEHNQLVEICNQYWQDFSKLIARMLEKAPKHLHNELLAMMQDHSSVYGSNYEKYLK